MLCDVKHSTLCRSGADGKRAVALVPAEVVGSIPTSDNPIGRAGRKTEQSHRHGAVRKRAGLITPRSQDRNLLPVFTLLRVS